MIVSKKVFLFTVILVLIFSSCSRDIYDPFQKPKRTSTRYKAYNQPMNVLGIHNGVANLNTRFTGIRDNKDNKVSYYSDNLHYTVGAFYRIGVQPRSGLLFGIDRYSFSGNFGLDQAEKSDFEYSYEEETVSQDETAWEIGNMEDNFFESHHTHKPHVPAQTYAINRFENTLWTVSITPYYQLPVFERRPQRMANAKRLYIFGGFAANFINPKLEDEKNETLTLNDNGDGDELIENIFGFSLPLGMGFSWRINQKIAVEYVFDYRFHFQNHGSGLVDTNSNDRQFSNSLGISYRIN